MSNLHRIAWLDAAIRSGACPDSRKLAERFEISVRQAQRDIEYLKYTMGAPLEYSAAKGGYYYKDKAFLLPSAMISEEEQQMLGYMANRYRAAGGTDARKLAGLLERLSAGEGKEGASFRNLPVIPVRPEEAKHYNTLREALERRSKVEMTYENSDGRTSSRLFHTYTLFHRNQAAYVSGFCELRREIRVFRISRIQKLVLRKESYEIPETYNDNYYTLGRCFLHTEPYMAEVEMTAISEPDNAALQAEHVEGPLYRFYFYTSEEMIQYLLSRKNSFRVLSPNWLKEKLRRRLEEIMRKNFGDDSICRTPPI